MRERNRGSGAQHRKTQQWFNRQQPYGKGGKSGKGSKNGKSSYQQHEASASSGSNAGSAARVSEKSNVDLLSWQAIHKLLDRNQQSNK